MNLISLIRPLSRSTYTVGLRVFRFDQEVLEYLRTTGQDWQARMNHVLRKYMTSYPV